MLWWIALGIVVFAVVLLLVVLSTLVGRVREFRRIADGVRGRVERAEHLRADLLTLQDRAAHLQEHVGPLGDRMATLRPAWLPEFTWRPVERAGWTGRVGTLKKNDQSDTPG